MKKLSVLIMLLGILAVGILGCSGEDSSQIRIGVIAEFDRRYAGGGSPPAKMRRKWPLWKSMMRAAFNWVKKNIRSS